MSARRHLAGVCLALAVAAATPASAQESRIAAEFRREREHIAESCSALSKAASCAIAVATGRPLHVAFGTIAPQNGVALGAAFGTSHAPSETWRLTWSGDAVGSLSGAWRAGAYMKLVHIPERTITVATGPASATDADALAIRPYSVIDLYGQTTSLDRVSFYGRGPDSRREDQSVFGLQEGIVGARAIVPVSASALARLNLSIVGEMNGRFVTIRDRGVDDIPAIGERFEELTPLGLAYHPPAFAQFGEAVRLRPSVAGRLMLDYDVGVRHFVAVGSQPLSFMQWRVDLEHEIPLYGRSIAVKASDVNDPNSCGGLSDLPGTAISRDRRGTVNVRALLITSSTAEGQYVPFFFQPTLGGSDINGQAGLASYDDYRFRAPHLLLFQETFEHSIWGPIGAWVQFDQGTVAIRRQDIGALSLKRTVAAGATIRAGGFPMVVLSYATGGPEGRHFSAVINTSLLGGSARPRLD